MLNDFSGADKVYIACGYTDLRKGIDGLARMVQQFELDPFTNTLFLFCGRRRDRVKGLYWEGDGFILLYKRLEQGVYRRGIPSEEKAAAGTLTNRYPDSRYNIGSRRTENDPAVRLDRSFLFVFYFYKLEEIFNEHSKYLGNVIGKF